MAEKYLQPLASGHIRVRIPTARGRITLGSYGTEPEAIDARDAALEKLLEIGTASTGGTTIRGLTEAFFTARELAEVRGVKKERSKWNKHVLTAFFAGWALRDVSSRDVRRWRDELHQRRACDVSKAKKKPSKKLSRQSVSHARNLLSAFFAWAIEEELVDENPVKDVRIKKELVTREAWGYLEPAEQQALISCEKTPESERLVMAFSLGTGMRPSEVCSLRIADVHVDESPHVVVRFGREGKPPKNGKIRRVQLFGVALDAARRRLEILETDDPFNPKKLLFASKRGARRRDERLLRGWRKHLTAAGITRELRVYDLRHTCATSLIAGWWGRRWTLEEVAGALGHSSTRVTERYAHIGETMMKAAARETEAACANGHSTVTTTWSARPADGPAQARPTVRDTHGTRGPRNPTIAAAPRMTTSALRSRMS